ncbi:MAG: hypothetical protein L6R41_006309 [Letrouitia leprolyta]|nr:MAG: hypothetical protein L6R41_006309 [Letrouitia leprolyta]
MPANPGDLPFSTLFSCCTFPDAGELGGEIRCHVCLQSFGWKIQSETPIKLRCGHIFGLTCIRKIISTSDELQQSFPPCPTCRADFLGVGTDPESVRARRFGVIRVQGQGQWGLPPPVQPFIGVLPPPQAQSQGTAPVQEPIAPNQTSSTANGEQDTGAPSEVQSQEAPGTPIQQQQNAPNRTANPEESFTSLVPNEIFAGNQQAAEQQPSRDPVAPAIDRDRPITTMSAEEEIEHWVNNLPPLGGGLFDTAPPTFNQRFWVRRMEHLWLAVFDAAIASSRRDVFYALHAYRTVYDIHWITTRRIPRLLELAQDNIRTLAVRLPEPWAELTGWMDRAPEFQIGNEELRELSIHSHRIYVSDGHRRRLEQAFQRRS